MRVRHLPAGHALHRAARSPDSSALLHAECSEGSVVLLRAAMCAAAMLLLCCMQAGRDRRAGRPCVHRPAEDSAWPILLADIGLLVALLAVLTAARCAGSLDVFARLLLQNQAAFNAVLQATGVHQAAQVGIDVPLGMLLDLWLDRCSLWSPGACCLPTAGESGGVPACCMWWRLACSGSGQPHARIARLQAVLRCLAAGSTPTVSCHAGGTSSPARPSASCMRWLCASCCGRRPAAC